jgi:hypothetical protein
VAFYVLLALAAAALVAWYLSWTAARLDRLHARVEGARAALDAQLVRRASITLELAASGLLDPASSVLIADAGHGARVTAEEGRELAESNLTQALRAALTADAVGELGEDPMGRALLADLGSASHRVTLARRFYNDAVRSALVVRGNRMVRLLRLAGRAPLPGSFEMDDDPPAALVR